MENKHGIMASGHNDMKWGRENGCYIKCIINNSKIQRKVTQYSKSAGQYQIKNRS